METVTKITADDLRAKLATMPEQTKVLFTAHSLPQRIIDGGDPYPSELRATAQAVANATCSHEYIPCEPSGLKITMIQVENPAISATAGRDCASAEITARGQV